MRVPRSHVNLQIRAIAGPSTIHAWDDELSCCNNHAVSKCLLLSSRRHRIYGDKRGHRKRTPSERGYNGCTGPALLSTAFCKHPNYSELAPNSMLRPLHVLFS